MLSEEKREKARAVWNDTFDKLYEKAPSMFDYGSNMIVGRVDEYEMFDAITGEELILMPKARAWMNDAPSANRPQGEWISTNGNDLPRPFQRALVCNEFGDIEIGYLKEDWFWKNDGSFPIVCPVAWMPLPEPYPWEGADDELQEKDG